MFYRQQWIGMQDAPQTQALTLDGPLDERPVGVGLTINNDATNIIGRMSGMLSASYTLNLADQNELSFGMSMGVIRNQIHFDKIRGDVQDPGLLQNAENRTTFDGSAGLSYRYQKFRAGIVSEQVLNRSLTYNNPTDGRMITFALVRHYLVSFQYAIPLTSTIQLEPLVVLRSAQGLPAQIDANATLRIRDVFWTNIAYRHQAGIGLSLGTLVSDRFMIGYNYEIATSDLRQTTSGSHEFMIGMRLRNRSGKPESSKSVSNKVVSDFKKENNAQYEKLDEISQKNESLNQQLLDYKKTIEEQQREINGLKTSIRSFDDELKATVEKLKVDLQTEKTFDEGSSYYLVVGAFKTLAEGKAFQKELKRETTLKPEIVQSETRTWFFIYSDVLKNPNEARLKIRNLDSTGIKPYLFGNPWIYKTKKLKQ